MTSPNELKHFVMFQKPTSSRDAAGGATNDYSDVAGVFAKISPMSTNERMIAAQSRSEATHRLTIRYNPDLIDMDGSWRIYWNKGGVDRYLMVVGFPRNLDERDEWVEVVANEGLRTA